NVVNYIETQHLFIPQLCENHLCHFYLLLSHKWMYTHLHDLRAKGDLQTKYYRINAPFDIAIRFTWLSHFILLNYRVLSHLAIALLKTKCLHQVNFFKKSLFEFLFNNNVKNADDVLNKLSALDVTSNNLMDYREKEIEELCGEASISILSKISLCSALRKANGSRCHIDLNNEKSISTVILLQNENFQLNRIFEEHKKFQEKMKKLQKEKDAIEEKAIHEKKKVNKTKILNELNFFSNQKLTEVDGMGLQISQWNFKFNMVAADTGIDTSERKRQILHLIQEIYPHLDQYDSIFVEAQSDFNVELNYDIALQALCENIRLNIVQHKLNDSNRQNESQVRIENRNRQSDQDSIPNENQNRQSDQDSIPSENQNRQSGQDIIPSENQQRKNELQVAIANSMKEIVNDTFKCDYCGKNLSSKQNLTRHRLIHSGYLLCFAFW
ncbi:Formin Domain containing protein, partial [Reticulomyxa filosa]